MGKKRTYEEIVKAVEWCVQMKESVGYIDGYKCKVIKFADILDLIHRLQSENERLNDMKFTQEHCDLYKENEWLKAELKRDLSEHEAFTKKAKAEIEALNGKYRNLEINYNSTWEEYRKYEVENAELQKQVDELKKRVDMYEKSKSFVYGDAIKDTAKEILEWLEKHCFFNGFDIVETYFRERYGVEVE